MEETRKLQSIAFPQEEQRAVQLALEIISTFIHPLTEKQVAKKEINICARSKQHILELVNKYEQDKHTEKWLIKEYASPMAMLESVTNSVMLEFKMDSFAR